MGNCIGSARALRFTNKKVSPNASDDQEFKAPVAVAGKKNAGTCNEENVLDSGLCKGPLPLSALLKSGEVQLHIANNCQRIKIVVNKKQLQLLKESLEALKSRHIVIQSVGKRRKKWRPSLATIPEF